MEAIQDRIVILNSHPGSGKTSWAIQEIKRKSEDEKIIYITPFLDEVERIIRDCPNKNFYQPSQDEGDGSKRKHFLELIISGKNIVSTHSLFTNLDDEIISALQLHDYILYLDEVFQTVEKFEFANTRSTKKDKENINYDPDRETRQDVNSLLNKKYIEIAEDYSVKWIDNDNMLSWYYKIKRLADRHLLYFVDGDLLMWTFPISVFREGIFKQVYILTYQFDYQIQAYYYSYFDLKYETYHAIKINDDPEEFEIRKSSDYQNDEIEWKKNIKNKIHILENSKLNNIGKIYYDSRNHVYKSSLSLSWYKDNPDLINVIKNNMINYFTNITKSKTDQRLWTSFKQHQDKLKSKYVSMKTWIPLNSRATNKHKETTHLCYLINRYLDPSYEKFFIKKNIVMNQDKYALSEMVQWIWRSAIREHKDIYIYIPSQRMRELLIKFLNDEEIEF